MLGARSDLQDDHWRCLRLRPSSLLLLTLLLPLLLLPPLLLLLPPLLLLCSQQLLPRPRLFRLALCQQLQAGLDGSEGGLGARKGEEE